MNYMQVLACQENRLKVIQDTEVKYTYETESSVNCLANFYQISQNPTLDPLENPNLLLGLNNGKIIQILIEED